MYRYIIELGYKGRRQLNHSAPLPKSAIIRLCSPRYQPHILTTTRHVRHTHIYRTLTPTGNNMAMPMKQPASHPHRTPIRNWRVNDCAHSCCFPAALRDDCFSRFWNTKNGDGVWSIYDNHKQHALNCVCVCSGWWKTLLVTLGNWGRE